MEIKSQSAGKLEGQIVLILTEGEASALHAIFGYEPDKFVEWFYANLGTHYLKPHEVAMRSLFATVKAEIPSHLAKFREARNILNKNAAELKKYDKIPR